MGPCAGGAVYSPADDRLHLHGEGLVYMFVTGPEVVKTVTHEEVAPRSWAAPPPHRKSAAWPTWPSRTTSSAADAAPLLQLPAAQQPEKPPVRPATTRPTGWTRRSTPGAGQPEQALRHEGLIVKTVDDGDFFELQPDYAKNIVIGFGRMEARRSASSPTSRWCWPAAWTSELDQGRALRALLRRLQHPGDHLRRRARLHARHRAGVRRHHQARRQAALRLRQVHGAQGHR